MPVRCQMQNIDVLGRDSSGLIQAVLALSRATRARPTFSRMLSVAVQMKWLGVSVVMSDVSQNGFDEVVDREEDASTDSLVRKLREEGLYDVEPGAGGGNEVEIKAGMASEPSSEHRMLVCRIVIWERAPPKSRYPPAVASEQDQGWASGWLIASTRQARSHFKSVDCLTNR